MRSLTDQLSQYAAYHRDRRNVHTHFVGIPMIVLALTTLLGRWVLVSWPLALPGGTAHIDLTAAGVVSSLVSLYYLRLDARFGLVMSVLLSILTLAGESLARHPFAEWLTLGLGLFVVGWIFQFVGHYFEGRKPAFVDDLIGLLIGPLFVVAEAGFLLGLRRDVEAQVIRQAGALR